MSDQTVLIDQFLSSVIGTIHPDEIFDLSLIHISEPTRPY